MLRRVLQASGTAKTQVFWLHTSGKVLSSAVAPSASSVPAKAPEKESWAYHEGAHSNLPADTWPAQPSEWKHATMVKDGEKPRGPQTYYPDFKYHLPYDTSKYRLYGIPEAFFTFMHERTGVLGPYILIWGSVITAFSKEYFIVNEETAAFLMFLVMPLYIASKIGPGIDKKVRSIYNDQCLTLEMMKRSKASQFTNEAAAIEEDMARGEAGKELFDVYNINVENMIEAEYRQRQEQVYQAFKRRLDYQVALQSLEESIVQKQLVAWVKEEVNKAIKSRGEKENIRQCIADLKSIAASS